jgi:hypothetical protein
MISKRFLKDIKPKSISLLRSIGILQDPSYVAMYNDFEPWLMERIMDFNDEAVTFR